MDVSLTLTEDQHAELMHHLFPGDGLEAVAFLLCGRAASGDRHRLVARRMFPIPHERCKRTPISVSWDGEDIAGLLHTAEIDALSLVKVHSHPSGFERFSEVDDASDEELLPTIASWVEHDIPHGSAVMLPSGRMFGRYHWRESALKPLTLISVAGSDLRFWWADKADGHAPAFAAAQDQAFGEGTTKQLQRLRIGVVGTSGTGSPIIEQLVRLGVGHLVLVDEDHVEYRNLNRITFSTSEHAALNEKKVYAAATHIARIGLGTTVTAFASSIDAPDAIRAISQCDVLFGCVDTVGARFTMNLISAHYLIPYFDLGVLLDAEQDGDLRGHIKDILGTVHYIAPGKSSLLTREFFTLDDVRAEGLHKNDPEAAKRQVEDKYIKGMQVSRPAVISVNMFAAALAINDFLARIHPYRQAPNKDIASIEFSLGQLRLTADEELENCHILGRFVGAGDQKPLLSLPQYGS
jgi:hypothetical protein